MNERWILHVDMDAFYASVEQRDNPELRGKPVIVGGSENRGVVAAASYEVRRFGVHSAMPTREALRRCPHAICVYPRMSHYQAISRQVFAVFHEFTPLVRTLAYVLPVTHGIRLIQDVMLRGSTAQLWSYAMLALIAALMLLYSWIMLRRGMTRA